MARSVEKVDHLDRLAQKALKALYAKSPKNGRKAGRQSAHSWDWVGDKVGFNAGYLYRVAMGQKRASNRLLIKLKLIPRQALAPACPKCGVVHTTKRCTANNRKPRPRAYHYVEFPVWTLSDLTALAAAQPDARVVVLGVGFDYENVKVGWQK